MLPIASIVSQHQMRRSLVGAVATDPVVPERRRRPRRRARAHVARVSRAPAPVRNSA